MSTLNIYTYRGTIEEQRNRNIIYEYYIAIDSYSEVHFLRSFFPSKYISFFLNLFNNPYINISIYPSFIFNIFIFISKPLILSIYLSIYNFTKITDVEKNIIYNKKLIENMKFFYLQIRIWSYNLIKVTLKSVDFIVPYPYNEKLIHVLLH